jgi:hypothetical protein
MADNFTRIQRWDNGVLVEDYTVPKPVEQFNAETITEQAVAALVDNTAFLDVALGDLTQAQVAIQVRALTRQNNQIIRLVLQRFDSTE